MDDRSAVAVRQWLGPDGACVVLAGGRGSRLFPLTLTLQKSLIPVLGRPLLDHVVEFWSTVTRRFVFVLKFGREQVEQRIRTYGLDAEIVEPPTLRGIADGIATAANRVGKRFIVVLSDCLCTGPLHIGARWALGVGVTTSRSPDDIRRSYSVELADRGQRVVRVREKPEVLPNDLCGMGYYFLDRRVFDYIAAMVPSPLRGEIEVTDVIQRMIEAGEPVHAIRFAGNYLNVTFPSDLAAAEALLAGR